LAPHPADKEPAAAVGLATVLTRPAKRTVAWWAGASRRTGFIGEKRFPRLLISSALWLHSGPAQTGLQGAAARHFVRPFTRSPPYGRGCGFGCAPCRPVWAGPDRVQGRRNSGKTAAKA